MAQDGVLDAIPAKPATCAEIIHAIESLTDEDSERLEQVALNRIIRIGRRAANGRTHEDLLQEAMTRTLEGQRHWYPGNVEFVPYLIGAVWSIASEWAGHRERNPGSPEYAGLESQLTKEDEEGNPISPFDGLAVCAPNSEEQMVEAEREAEQQALVNAIEQHFAEDENASYVLMGWQDGMDGPAIMEACGFSETTYRAIVRRIKRNSQKITEERHGR
jgi:DNA-directed RNA polymerase specialized sigma24 family protein